MKRPVTAALLALLVLATVVWRGGGSVPILGQAAIGNPELLLPGQAEVLAGMPTHSVYLQAQDGAVFEWHPDSRARPIATDMTAIHLPGGVPATMERLNVAGKQRIVGIFGVTSWIAPGGEAAVVYDPADAALWALHAAELKPLPLGTVSVGGPPTVVWSADGKDAAYLSGDPSQLWIWRVGAFAQRLGLAAGAPLAVRPDGAVVLAVADRLAVEWPRLDRPLLLSLLNPVTAAPTGSIALAVGSGRLFRVDGETGQAMPVGVKMRDFVAAAFGPASELAVLTRGRIPSVVWITGSGHRVVSRLPRELRLPARTVKLTFVGKRLAASLQGPDGYATYLLSGGQD